MSAAVSAKDRITCHVLDTTLGQPARSLRVKLELVPPTATDSDTTSVTIAPKTFESLTDEDGRIRSWLPYSSVNSSGEVPVHTLEDVLSAAEASPAAATTTTMTTRWTLRFDTASYFGGEDKTFFPEAIVVFRVQKGQQYHVPLLLAPYGYSTYRGS